MNIPRLLAVAVALVGCTDGPCVTPPCPEGSAVSITLRSAAARESPLVATISVSGRIVTTMSCSDSCVVPGSAGTYVLDVSASGFMPIHRTIQVQGTSPQCGCGITHTVPITLDLISQ